jgi:SecD/SecF fusion protein
MKNVPRFIFNFSQNGAGLWAKMTHDNLKRSIAILMDQQVYFTPVVKSEIKGGNCALTGDFTADEMKSFVSIVKNGELPASFQLK